MKKLLLGVIVVLLLGLGAGYFFGWYFQPQQELQPRLPVVESELFPELEVQLFFAGQGREPLVQETAFIPGCNDEESCVQGVVEALIEGSQQGGLPVLPPQTQLLNVEIQNDLVRLDFSDELVNFHPGGSLSELQTIYALANSLSLSFPYIRQVQLLIEGQELQTLKGHARIDQPIYADFSFGEQSLDMLDHAPTIDHLIEEVIEN
jgi:hypothetical protein